MFLNNTIHKMIKNEKPEEGKKIKKCTKLHN